MKKIIFACCVLATSAAHAAVLVISNAYHIEQFDSITGADLGALATLSGEAMGLAFDASGNLYVATRTAPLNSIQKITPGGLVSTFATGFANVTGLAFDTDGNLYVADTSAGGADFIYKVTSGGAVSTFAGGFIGAFGGPFGLAFDSGGNLFAACFGSDTIKEVTPGGTVSSFAHLQNTFGLAFDTVGNLYAGDYSGRITKFTPDGGRSTFAEQGPVSTNGIAFDTNGNLFAVTGGIGRINRIASDGTVSTIANSGGTFIAVTPVVPEPSALALISMGFGVALISRRFSTFGGRY